MPSSGRILKIENKAPYSTVKKTKEHRNWFDMAIDSSGRVWASQLKSCTVMVYSNSLVTKYQIDMATMVCAINRRVKLNIYEWHRNKMIIIDKVSGAGFVFHHFKKVLNFKENLDWVVEKRVKKNEMIICGLHYTTRTNSMLKYNLLTRSILYEERKSSDSSQKIIKDPNSVIELYFKIGRPFIRLLIKNNNTCDLEVPVLQIPHETKLWLHPNQKMLFVSTDLRVLVYKLSFTTMRFLREIDVSKLRGVEVENSRAISHVAPIGDQLFIKVSRQLLEVFLD